MGNACSSGCPQPQLLPISWLTPKLTPRLWLLLIPTLSSSSVTSSRPAPRLTLSPSQEEGQAGARTRSQSSQTLSRQGSWSSFLAPRGEPTLLKLH